MLDYLRIMLNARTAKMNERGASAVEYGLLIAGIAALIVVIVFAFGDNLKAIFESTCASIASPATAADCAADQARSCRGVAAHAAATCPAVSDFIRPPRSGEPMHEVRQARMRTATSAVPPPSSTAS